MRVLALGAALGLAALSLTPIGAVHASAGPAQAVTRTGCPAAEALVSKATWSHHKLAHGVTLAEGTAQDSQGYVNLHVLRVSLTTKHVRVGPLVRSLADRLPLTTLAAHRKGLVAAVNTGFFDFVTGAPTGPLIASGFPLVMTNRLHTEVGIDTKNRVEAGKVRLAYRAVGSNGQLGVRALNDLVAPRGLTVYTASWGSHAVALGSGVSRYVSAKGRTSSLGHYRHVQSSGYLFVAKGTTAKTWLAKVGTGSTVHLAGKIVTKAKYPFTQGYAPGVRIVKKAGQARTGFHCDSANTKTPARTSIGWAKGGRELIIAEVADHPGTVLHGLDNDQMSALMVQLGAQRAYEFDGSGSTELLAKLPGTSSLSLRIYPADGAQRPMSLGLGIYAKR